MTYPSLTEAPNLSFLHGNPDDRVEESNPVPRKLQPQPSPCPLPFKGRTIVLVGSVALSSEPLPHESFKLVVPPARLLAANTLANGLNSKMSDHVAEQDPGQVHCRSSPTKARKRTCTDGSSDDFSSCACVWARSSALKEAVEATALSSC